MINKSFTVERKFNTRNFVIVLLVFSSVIFLANLFLSFTPSTYFCGLCHKGEYRYWQKSSHYPNGCNSCHRRSDFFSFLSYRISVLRMTGNTIVPFFYERPIKADLAAENCLSCHQKIRNEQKISKGIRMRHKEPIEAGYECTYCHSKIVHKNAVKGSSQTSMNKCFTCHDNVQAVGECEICHIQGKKVKAKNKYGLWQAAHGKKWRNLHGMGNLKSCSLCHQSSFCARCHVIPLPHDSSFLTLHGKMVKAVNKKVCYNCHKVQLCNSCHNTQIPHPSGFIREHPKVLKRIGRSKCLMCHLEDGCNRCHSRHQHPGLPWVYMKWLRLGAGLK